MLITLTALFYFFANVGFPQHHRCVTHLYGITIGGFVQVMLMQADSKAARSAKLVTYLDDLAAM